MLHLFPNREILLAKLVQPILHRLMRVFLTHFMVVITAGQTCAAPTSAAEGEDKLDSSELYPPFFEEKESFGFNVADDIA